jgi:hypothetical protein
MTTSNDLWFVEIECRGAHNYTQHFVLDAAGTPEGKLDEPHAAMAALEIACGAERLSFMMPDRHIKATVFLISEDGNRKHGCAAEARREGDHYVDHCGDRVRVRDDRVLMFSVGEPL